ncbi:MAG: SDR family oxidoreductase [Chloroflexi bacterium]|nr:SDR family oxidoreductase [Chloroflexota bacterium]
MSQQRRAVLVTGAGGGLGRAVSQAFARAGYDVAVNYGHSRDDAETTAEAVRACGGHAQLVHADVADDTAVRAMVDAVVAAFGGLDVLVNNAGVTQFIPMADLEAITDEHWDLLLGVNLKGPFYCARAAAPHLRQRHGCVVNVTTTSAFLPGGSSIPYMASKAGLVMLTRSLAQALRPEVRANAVAPGWLDTGWWDKYAPPEVKAHLHSPTYPAPADLDDIARAVLLLAETPSINGQTLVVDRGQLMR